MNYYHAKDAGQPLAGVYFNVYDRIGGMPVGVYATDNPDEIAALDKLCGGIVSQISGEEYAQAKKKGSKLGVTSYAAWRPTPVQDSSNRGLVMKGNGAAVVCEQQAPQAPEEPVVEIKATVETLDDALKIGEVAPPPIMEPVQEKKPKRKR